MSLILIAILTFAAWAWLLLFHGGYWRARERLDPLGLEPADLPEVVAVIPARNEAASIGAVVAAHMQASYPGAFSLVLVDDDSTDGTAEIARAAATGARRLELLRAPPLAQGWTGKLNAVNAGIARANEIAPGARYLLLTDADIVLSQTTIMRLVVKAEKEDLALVSLMAQLDARGLSGGLLIPAFVYFFQKLYPFALANDPKSSVAAAAGGVMLVRRDALQRAGGIEQIRDQLIDDCALARLLKVAGERTWIGLADAEAQSLRDNRSLRSIWSMVARTAFTQLDHSWAKLLACAAGMGLIYLAPPAIAFLTPIHGNSAAAIFALAAFFLMALSWSPTLRLFGKPGWAGFFLPVAAAFYLAMTVSSGLDHARGRGGFWKGRAYP